MLKLRMVNHRNRSTILRAAYRDLIRYGYSEIWIISCLSEASGVRFMKGLSQVSAFNKSITFRAEVISHPHPLFSQ